MAEKVCNGCGNHDKEESSFAKELLNGYKKQCRNWFIIALVELAMIFSIVSGFIWFISNADIETYTVEQSTKDGGNANYIGNDGDIVNGLPKGNNTQN